MIVSGFYPCSLFVRICFFSTTRHFISYAIISPIDFFFVRVCLCGYRGGFIFFAWMALYLALTRGESGLNRGKVELFVDFPINGLDMSPYCRGKLIFVA